MRYISPKFWVDEIYQSHMYGHYPSKRCWHVCFCFVGAHGVHLGWTWTCPFLQWQFPGVDGDMHVISNITRHTRNRRRSLSHYDGNLRSLKSFIFLRYRTNKSAKATNNTRLQMGISIDNMIPNRHASLFNVRNIIFHLLKKYLFE